jgi:hypothetical protein
LNAKCYHSVRIFSQRPPKYTDVPWFNFFVSASASTLEAEVTEPNIGNILESMTTKENAVQNLSNETEASTGDLLFQDLD